MHRKFEAGPQTTLQGWGCDRYRFTYAPLALHYDPREFPMFAADVAQLVTKLRETAVAASGSSHPKPQHLCH
jgi:hypothetical protein